MNVGEEVIFPGKLLLAAARLTRAARLMRQASSFQPAHSGGPDRGRRARC